MLKLEEWGMIRNLKNSGLNITEIAKQFNMDRKTIRKHLNSNTAPKYKRKQLNSILDPYKDYIEKRLEKYNLTAKKIYKEIIKQGYKGKYGVLNKLVQQIKDNNRTKAVLRFETLPGEQAQVDWGYFGKFYDQELKKEVKLCCFFMVLGFSRTKFIYFFDADDTHNFLVGHNKAFEYFGGYTKEILYDNLKSVVIKRALRASDSTFNKNFLDFSSYYGFNPILARPYKPNTKGKVENTVRYVRNDFFAGEKFYSLNDLNHKALLWLEDVNNTIHSTTFEVPFARLKREDLIPVKGSLYDLSKCYYRKVFIDSHINFNAKKYSVPFKYVNKEVSIKFADTTITVFYRDEIIASHKVDQSNKVYITKDEHLKGLRELRYKRYKPKLPKEKKGSPKIILTKAKYNDELVVVRDLSIYQGVLQ